METHSPSHLYVLFFRLCVDWQAEADQVMDHQLPDVSGGALAGLFCEFFQLPVGGGWESDNDFYTFDTGN